MSNCDLCNKQIATYEVVRIPLSEMQQAVLEGFNPFKTPGIDIPKLGAAFGIGDEQMFQQWRKRLMADTTDWGLCPTCTEAFRGVRSFDYKKGTVVDPVVGQHYKAAEVEAESMDAARKKIESQIFQGLSIHSERIISDGKPETAKVLLKQWRKLMQKRKVPKGANIVGKMELARPERKIVLIEAFDEQTARVQAGVLLPKSWTPKRSFLMNT